MKEAGRIIAWILVVSAAVIACFRWAQGLGSVTNLSDAWPWGLWIAFDVLCGVALASGGFTTAAVVYVLGRDRYRPVARAAILTAFLGYMLVTAALLVDLGRPWAIVHLVWMWNPHSVLFEVGWCVLLYTTVLALEFAPVILERWEKRFERLLRFLERIKIALVIAGIGLSTLHQSSLGSLFLAAEHRLEPLWFTPMLPVLFFVSAVTAGPAVVIIESSISSRTMGRNLERDILGGLASAIPWLASAWIVIRFADIAAAGELGLLIEGTIVTAMFWVEILLPLAAVLLLAAKRLRELPAVQLLGAILTASGVIVNRFNVSLTAMPDITSGSTYFPSWQEVFITLGMVSAGVLAFGAVTKRFRVFGNHARKALS